MALNLFRNTKSTERRRHLLLSVVRGEGVHSDPLPATDHAAAAGESRARVRAAIERLPARDRQLLLLRAEGYSYRDLARALELNEASVGTLLARARQAFRAAYGSASDAS